MFPSTYVCNAKQKSCIQYSGGFTRGCIRMRPLFVLVDKHTRGGGGLIHSTFMLRNLGQHHSHVAAIV